MKKTLLLSLWFVPFLVFGQGISFTPTGYFPGNVTAGGQFVGNGATLSGLLIAKTNGNVRVSFSGDSIVSQPLPTWPQYLGSYSSYFASAGYITNYGVNGGRAYQDATNYSTTAHLNRPQNPYEVGWFFYHGGGNDIADGRTYAQTYTDLKSIWSQARADGYKVVAVTITPRLGDAYTTLNGYILSDPTLYDYVIRADLIMPDPSNATYYYDTTHPTVAGAQLLANYIASCLESRGPWTLIPIAYSPYGTNYTLQLNPQGTNVSIGSTNKTSSLWVNGPINASNSIGTKGGLDVGSFTDVGEGKLNVTSQVAIGTTFPGVAYSLSTGAGITMASGNDLDWNLGNARIGEDSYNLLFKTYGSSLATRMKIDRYGSIGIGTTAPTSLLHVAGPIATSVQLSGAMTFGETNSTIIANADGVYPLPTAVGKNGRFYILSTVAPCTAAVFTNANGVELIGGALSRTTTKSNETYVVQAIHVTGFTNYIICSHWIEP